MSAVDVDPLKCAKIAANLLHSSGGPGIVEEATAWAQLGSLLVNIRDHAVDNAAHNAAHAASAYLTDPSDENLAELHRTIIVWRSQVAA